MTGNFSLGWNFLGLFLLEGKSCTSRKNIFMSFFFPDGTSNYIICCYLRAGYRRYIYACSEVRFFLLLKKSYNFVLRAFVRSTGDQVWKTFMKMLKAFFSVWVGGYGTFATIILWNYRLLNFWVTLSVKNPSAKNFVGKKYSSVKNFVTKQIIRHFLPTNFFTRL